MSFPPVTDQALSNDWNADLLQLYQSGEMTDCSFLVGCDNTGYKVCIRNCLAQFEVTSYKFFSGVQMPLVDPLLIESIFQETA
jgi:hypothetical protein